MIDDVPLLTLDQLRELRMLDRAWAGARLRLAEAVADAKDAKADHDAARKAVLAYLHDCLTQTPPRLPLFDREDQAQREAEDRMLMSHAEHES